jgi:hypothetical protein
MQKARDTRNAVEDEAGSQRENDINEGCRRMAENERTNEFGIIGN